MNKSDLIKEVALRLGSTNVATQRSVDAIFQCIAETLSNGESIVIQGFGSLTIHERKARIGVNPVTRERLEIKAKKIVKYIPSKNIIVK